MQVASLVPHVFYDLIARLTPGVVLIGSAYIVFAGPKEVIENLGPRIDRQSGGWPLGFLVLIAVCLAAYILAVVMTGVWTWLEQLTARVPLFRKARDGVLRECQRRAVADAETTAKALGTKPGILGREFPSIPFMDDLVRLRVPTAGARLLKVRAERRMCAVLFMGWSVMAIAYVCRLRGGYSLESWGTEAALLFASSGVFHMMRRLHRHYVTGLCNNWLLTMDLANAGDTAR